VTTKKELFESDPSNLERETLLLIAHYTLFHDEKGYWHLIKTDMAQDSDDQEVIGDSEELFDLFRLLYSEHIENHKKFFNL
jgi:hypothetical protein